MNTELFKDIKMPSTETEETAEKSSVAIADPAKTIVENDDDKPEDMPTELDLLKRRAQLMGITFSNNIGLDALKEKVSAAQNPEKVVTTTISKDEITINDGSNTVNPLAGVNKATEKPMSLRQYLIQEKMKLIRVRITNLDPKKKDLPGEIITVANEYLGTVRKYVPFGEVTDNGYHIPKCMYDVLKDRTFVSIKTRKGTKGEQIVEHQNAREFSLEILPPLTVDELAKLAASQSAAGGV